MGIGVAYLTPEAKARLDIDAMLGAAGWTVPDADSTNLAAAQEARDEREESELVHRFTYDELLQRDKVSLDITWLRDE